MSQIINEMTCEDAMEQLDDLIVRLRDLFSMIEMEITKAEHDVSEVDRIFMMLRPEEMYQANQRAIQARERARALHGVEYYLGNILAEYAPQDEDKED